MARDHPATDRTSIAWLAIAVVSFVAFAILTWLVASRANLAFDQPLLDLARSWSGLKGFWTFVSDLSNYPMVAVGVGIVLWLLWKGRRREAVLVVILLVAATAGSEGVKQLVHRERPAETQVEGVVYSYPSGHVLEVLTIFGIISLIVWRSALPRPVRVTVPVVSAILVVIVAVARVALAAHYPTDLVGGAVAGAGTLATFAGLTSREEAPTGKTSDDRAGPSPPKSR